MTTLYRVFDVWGELLYIGISSSPFGRFAQHEQDQDKDWWDRVASFTLVRFEERVDALKAEAQAIVDEKPTFNVMHSTTRQRKKGRTGQLLTPEGARALDRMCLTHEPPIRNTAELGRLAGISRPTLSRFVNGKFASETTRYKLAEALGMTRDEFDARVDGATDPVSA